MSYLDDFIASMSDINPSAFAALPPNARAPLAINAAAGGLTTFGQGVSSVGRLMQGIQERQASKATSAQLRVEAGQAEASAQRQAFDIDQQTQLITSRALAVAASSGGGASDPSVIDLIARDAARGSYLKSVALYGGEDRARLLQSQAEVADYEGKAARQNAIEEGVVGMAGAAAGLLRSQGQGAVLAQDSGVTSILKTQGRGASLFQRFGGGGPPPVSGGDDFGWKGAGGF